MVPRRRFLAALFLPGLAACATRTGADGQRATVIDPRYLAKTEIDRVIDTARGEVIDGLRRFADKLYRRNPREWRQAGLPDREAALGRLFAAGHAPGALDFPELEGRREGAAALRAFHPDYAGDRVLALMAGLLGMVHAAFEHRDSSYLLDDLDEQKLYNCARNLEIAMWKLATAKQPSGEPVLLANELDPQNRNVSFEREFGRIVGLLDFLAKVVADRHGRTITRLTQSLATAVFLPVGALGFR